MQVAVAVHWQLALNEGMHAAMRRKSQMHQVVPNPCGLVHNMRSLAVRMQGATAYAQAATATGCTNATILNYL